MKRYLNKIFILIMTACIALLALAGCVTLDDVTPKRLGKQEGLWLYYGNTRSRTDGTEKQDILQTVEFEGKTYEKDGYVIDNYKYITDIKTIVYELDLLDIKKTILYRYNYQEKNGGVLYAFDTNTSVSMYLSDYYFYVKSSNCGILFDTSLNLIGTDFADYKLKKDVLYRYSEQPKFDGERTGWLLEWYSNGENKSVWSIGREGDSHYLYYVGDYFYICTDDNKGFWLAECVNLQNSELIVFNIKIQNAFEIDGEFYITQSRRDGYNGGEIYKVTGSDVQLFYDSGATKHPGQGSHPIIEYTDDEYVYFSNELDNGRHDNFKMDRNTHAVFKSAELKDVERKYFKITVGEYTFYQGYRNYFELADVDSFCVYLYREKANKKEVMQYISSEDDDSIGRKRRCFYNDICDF